MKRYEIKNDDPRKMLEQYMSAETDEVKNVVGNLLEGYPMTKTPKFDAISIIAEGPADEVKN